MDWRKAKNIIAYLLLAINVGLFVGIIYYASNQGIPRETLQNTKKILESRGVIVECAIPAYDKNTPMLSYGNKKFDKSMIVQKLIGKSINDGEQKKTEDAYIFENGSKKLVFENGNTLVYTDESPGSNVDIVHIEAAEKFIWKYLKDAGLVDTSYILDENSVKQGKNVSFTYVENYKGFLVFDNYVKVVVSSRGVTYLESKYKQVIGLSSDKIGNLAAAYQVLLENFDGSRKFNITDIDIGYKDTGSQEQNDTLQSTKQLPVWRIKIKDCEMPLFFRASDGKEIK